MKRPIFSHLLVNADIARPPKSHDKFYALSWMRNLIERIGMKLELGPLVSYVTDPAIRGMTGIAGIKTSHCAFHIFDEPPAFIKFDLFSCGRFDPEDVLASIDDAFGIIGQPDCVLIDREHGLVLEFGERQGWRRP